MTQKIESTAKTTETSIRIVNSIRELDGATIDELTDHLQLSRSTIHRHLATLLQHNYVVRENNRYQIGLGYLTMGGYAQRQVVAYPQIKEKVDALACQTGERAQFLVEENGQRVYLYTEVGESAVQTGARIGRRGPLHPSAGGKAILANLPESRVYEIIEKHGLDGGSEKSISTGETLFQELDEIRERGYATNRRETNDGVNAIGTAVLDEEGTVIGALSVAGPANRLKNDRLSGEILDAVLSEANELELYIEHSL